MQHMSITLAATSCPRPMAGRAKPTALGPARQLLLATRAVEIILLFELAIRQKYPGEWPIHGYHATA